MYLHLLDQIRAKHRKYDGDLQPPCTESALAEMRRASQLKLGVDVPEAYCRFLQITDGLDWNGLQVFATHRSAIVGHADRHIGGFIEANRDLGMLDKYAFLAFADDATALYGLDLSPGTFQVRSIPAMSPLGTFGTFEELLAEALADHL